MGTFRVTCADRETGQDYTVDVEADRPSQAVRAAADLGHLSSRATQIATPPPPVVITQAPADTGVSGAMLAEMQRLRKLEEKKSGFSIGRVIVMLIAVPVVLIAIFLIVEGIRDMSGPPNIIRGGR